MRIKDQLPGTEPLFLMDGSAFVYRGFYANQGLARSDGFPTGALFIVARVLLKILREEQPKHFVFVLDGKGPNFRHALYPDYKAQRKATPEGLIAQLTPIRNMVQALGVPLLLSEECEADDVIASLTRTYRDSHGVVIIGADKDLKQCLHPRVLLWDPAVKDGKITTLESFRTETGLEPEQWPDLQAIIGDSSDNIPGIPGVGVKTAEKIFKDYKNLEEIAANVGMLPLAVRKKFDGHLDAMFLYRKLTKLDCDRCGHVDERSLDLNPVNVQAATSILREYELESLTREVQRLIGQSSPNAGAGQSNGAMQGSLLDTPKAQDRAVCADVSGLPNLSGQRVALMPGENETLLALNGAEWLYTGPMQPLVESLSRAVASSRETRLITPDLKRLLGLASAFKTIPAARWFDLSLAAYLLDPEQQDYGWPRLAGYWSTQLGLAPGNPGLLALRVAEELARQLEGAQLAALLRDMELPLVPVLRGMEEAGVRLDTLLLSEYLESVQTDLVRLTEEIYHHAGGEFNIRSAQQLGEVLFKRLGLPATRKTQGGQASTSKDVLENLTGKHPVVAALREYRILDKLRSTYLEPLPRLMGQDGRIRTTFNQTGTATGRLSSSNPNLQNIPARGDLGRRMRACFTAQPGTALVSADYSQIELRVLACVSGDPELLAAFHDNADIHSRTAGLLYDCAPESVTSDQRRAAKTINFGLIYGMGAQKLAQELAISMTESREFIARYFSKLSVLRDFYARVKEQAREQGYVVTLTGRRRLLPNIASASQQLRALAERQAINTIIQGSAADIIKLAMLAVAKDPVLVELEARLLLQIHDELLFEAPETNAAKVGERVSQLMFDVAPGGEKLAVPLLVEWNSGFNWGK